MSKDFQILGLCPHIIGEERATLAADRQTIVTSKPINGIGALQVQVNDQWMVPPQGIQSQAILTSSLKEPFQVVPGANTVTVQTGTARATVTFPVGYQTAASIVATMSAAAFPPGARAPVFIASSSNGYLTVTEPNSVSTASRILISGPAALGLGFGVQNGSVGKQVIPAWSLYSRTFVGGLLPAAQRGYFLRFLAPVKQNFSYSITNPVAPNQCPRCLGTEIENDYQFDSTGAALTIVDTNLLYQMCLKAILTELKSNVYYPWYGTSLIQSIGTKAGPGSAQAIQQTIRTALTNVQNLQASQAKFQRVSAAERLYSIDQVQATQSPVDPTAFLVNVVVRSYSGAPIPAITIVYTAPGAFAIPGTNGLSAGTYG